MDREQPPSKPVLGRVYSRTVYVRMDSAEPEWWNKLLEQVPVAQQCKITDCTFAPPGHRKHGCRERDYSLYESRLIIKYLVHYDVIAYGKGLSVWDTMHERGYLRHRTSESLKNFFRRTLIIDIKGHRLPQELENQFTELRV